MARNSSHNKRLRKQSRKASWNGSSHTNLRTEKLTRTQRQKKGSEKRPIWWQAELTRLFEAREKLRKSMEKKGNQAQAA